MIPFSEAEIEGTVGARFERVVSAMPQALAIAQGSQTWSYQDVFDASEAYRVGFARLKADQPVGLVFSHGVEAIFAMMGAIRAGVPVFPIDPEAPPAALADCLADCQLVVTEPAFAQWCAERLEGQTVVVGAQGVTSQADKPGLAASVGSEVRPEKPCVVYLTSGSTGQSKGVIRSHRSLCRRVWLLPHRHNYGPPDRIAHLFSFAHAGSIPVVLGGLLTGCALDIHDLRDIDIAKFVAAAGQREVTIFQLTPALLRAMLENFTSGCGAWQPRLIYVVGGMLDPEDLLALRDQLGWTGKVVNRFAITESCLSSEWTVAYDDLKSSGTVPAGYPVEGIELSIVDEEGEVLPAGKTGEIVVTGDYMADGYWGRPDLTAERFVPAPLPGRPHRQKFVTGDMGRLQEDGLLELFGRKDNMVKLRGYRIELGEIESALRRLDGVSNAAVVLQRSARSEYLVGYVQNVRGALVSSFELRAALLRQMPEFMVPRRILVLDQMPLTAGGKIDRGSLPGLDRSRPDGAPDAEPPLGETEQFLADIWADVLEIDVIGRRDDLFELGGDSLSALHVAVEIQKRLDCQFFETDLLAATDLIGMAKFVEGLVKAA
ncbi:non-ribosomal peptide synthetase [Rhodovibrionaceae bacterium A322]